MRDRWPVFFAMTVSSLAVLATAITAGLALSQGTQPAAFGLGLAGMLAASLGMLAIIRWTLDAGETYPDIAAAAPSPRVLPGLRRPCTRMSARSRNRRARANRFGRKASATTSSSSTRRAPDARIATYFNQIAGNFPRHG